MCNYKLWRKTSHVPYKTFIHLKMNVYLYSVNNSEEEKSRDIEDLQTANLFSMYDKSSWR